MTSVCQGLSSLASGGGKMRDPGNEAGAGPLGTRMERALLTVCHAQKRRALGSRIVSAPVGGYGLICLLSEQLRTFVAVVTKLTSIYWSLSFLRGSYALDTFL